MSADDTTLRAEQIRESTGIAWERACLQAERERDEPAEVTVMPMRRPNRTTPEPDTIFVGKREARRGRPYIFGCE